MQLPVHNVRGRKLKTILQCYVGQWTFVVKLVLFYNVSASMR